MRKRLLSAVGILAVAAAAGTTFALAHGGDGTQIHACVSNTNGDVRLVSPTEACRSSEHAVDWNVSGPAGAAGPAGQAGAAGPAGPAGADGRDGAAGRDGADGATGPAGPQGPKGDTGPQGPKGDSGAAGGGSAPSEPSTAKVGTIRIVGAQQGTFLGTAPNGRMDVLSFTHELVSPRDAASGLPTGKRQHKPFTIVKRLDRASIQLFRALANNENLPTVELDILARGGTTAYARVKLTNASVSSRALADAGKTSHHELETISFTYQKIEWTFVDGGITAEDDWEAPIA